MAWTRSYKGVPGARWDWRAKVWRLDRLATLEDWARQHPSRMTPAKKAELEHTRGEYFYARGQMLEAVSQGSGCLTTDELGACAREWGVQEEAVVAVAERLYREGVLSYDYVGPVKGHPLGNWTHWYYLTPEPKEASREETTEGNGGVGDEAEPEAGAAGTDSDASAVWWDFA